MKIAYCQISAHPTFIGNHGSYCREPFFGKNDPLLTKSSEKQIYELCDKIEKRYHMIFLDKLTQVLESISGLGIECLVFPEYTIPAQCLNKLNEFSRKENCICVCASHTV